jgi:hypothetical protein
MEYRFNNTTYVSMAELNLAIAKFWLSDWPPKRRAVFTESSDAQLVDEAIDSLNLDGRHDKDMPGLMRDGPLPGVDRCWLINAFRYLRTEQSNADKDAA